MQIVQPRNLSTISVLLKFQLANLLQKKTRVLMTASMDGAGTHSGGGYAVHATSLVRAAKSSLHRAEQSSYLFQVNKPELRGID